MPTIRPFRGLRYDPGIAGNIVDLVAPPYDIIYDDWREKLYDRNPYNIIRLIKTREESGDADALTKYSRAADYIKDWMGSGVLKREDEPAVYVRADTYKVNGEEKTRFGFVALMKVEEFGNTVHPHEMTLAGPKIDRLNLVKATETNLSQIFSIFRDPQNDIQDMILNVAEGQPDFDFMDEQDIRRRLWIVKDESFAARLTQLMQERDIIIADGHHRYETAIAYKSLMEKTRTSDDEPFDYVTMYFSSADAPGMTILPTHRKIGGYDKLDRDGLFNRMAPDFEITEAGTNDLQQVIDVIAKDAETQNTYGVYSCDGYHIARKRTPASPKELDVDVLHNDIIEDMLGITKEDIAAGNFVHFSKSAEHAIEDINNAKDQMAFIMNAITPEELFRKVLDGNRMPQKSTYFYPKTMSGLVMYKIDRDSF